MARKFIKKIFSPGQKDRSIDYWDEIAGIPKVVRKMAVKRQVRPGFQELEMLKIRLSAAEAQLTEIKRLRKPTGKASIEEREKKISSAARKRDKIKKEMKPLLAKGKEWEDEQIFRCIHGHGTMTGLHYFYYNFGFIDANIKGGGGSKLIRPNYRSADDWVYRALQEAQDTSTGIVMAKRRRFGWSWILVNYVVYNLLFKDGNIFFVTKDENDREKFFTRIDQFYERLPDFLKKRKNNDRVELKTYFPSERIADIRGVDPKSLPLAVLRCASPRTIASVSGGTCSAFIIDEAGEIPNLMGVLKEGIPMLADEDGLERAGVLVMGGTVGEMHVSGKVLKRVFDNPKPFFVRSIFIPGWMGYKPDNLGNEDKERAIEFIENSIRMYEEANMMDQAISMRQKYPMSKKDAFLVNNLEKLLPVDLLTVATDNQDLNPHPTEFGTFYKDPSNGRIVFQRQKAAEAKADQDEKHIGWGQWHILEHPIEALSQYEDPYVAGCDPTDLDKDTFGEKKAKSNMILSDFAACIYKRQQEVNGISDFPAAVYYGRPDELDTAYEQTALACEYYSQAKINIERAKGGRMQSWLITNDYGHLLAYGAGQTQNFDTSDKVWGYNSSPRWWTHMVTKCKDHLKKHFLKPMPIRLLNEMYDCRERNTDLLVAFLAALMLCLEMDIREERGKPKAKVKKKKGVHPLWVKTQNGFMPTRRQAVGSPLHNLQMRRHNATK